MQPHRGADLIRGGRGEVGESLRGRIVPLELHEAVSADDLAVMQPRTAAEMREHLALQIGVADLEGKSLGAVPEAGFEKEAGLPAAQVSPIPVVGAARV